MSRLPGVVFATIVSLTITAFWLEVGSPEGLIATIAIAVWLLALGGIGALVASRRRDNPVGWLMLTISLLLTVHSFATSYATYSFIHGRELPGAMFAAWLTIWLLVPGFALFIHLLLLFPTGTLPSPRWRWVRRLANAMLVVVSVVPAIEPKRIDYIPELDNPLGVEQAQQPIAIIGNVGETLLTALVVLAVVSVFLRFRRARGTEREQIKWFAYAVAMIPFLGLLSTPVDAIDGDGASYGAFAVNMTAALLIPLSLGIAILRKRLYDIDVIVNRTLVYGGLTALLAGTYPAIVVVLQGVLAPVAADSDLAIAGSTLTVAALFRPLRARVQAFIDRRFYRRKYDAAATLEDFSRHLRDELELASLSSELVSVVQRTMHPAHASLWLRSKVTR